MTTSPSTTGTLTPFTRLFDDAAIFPPGNAPIGEAVRNHLAWRAGLAASFVGPFICSTPRWPELRAELKTELQRVASLDEPMELCLTVPDGVQALAAALAEVATEPLVVLRAVEVAVGHDDAATAAAEVRAVLPKGVEAYLEFPRAADPHGVASALTGTGLQLKFRTGGVNADAFPDKRELAEAIIAAVTAGVPFKLTAGLHHAVRHWDIATGFDHHGFLNVMLAVAAAQRGASTRHVQALLAQLHAPTLVAAFDQLTDDETAAVRNRFRSFGTCSIREPLEDLTALNLLPGGAVV